MTGYGNGAPWPDDVTPARQDDVALADGPHRLVQVPHICTARNCSCRLKGRFDLPQEQCVACRTAWPCKYASSAGEAS